MKNGNRRGLDDYVDVATRIGQFYEKYPEGALRFAWERKDWHGGQIVSPYFTSPEDAGKYLASIVNSNLTLIQFKGNEWVGAEGEDYTRAVMVCETIRPGSVVA